MPGNGLDGAYYFTFFMWPKPLQLPGNYVYPYYNMRSQKGEGFRWTKWTMLWICVK